MSKFASVEAALDYAIEREQEAYDFYQELAQQTPNPTLQKTLTAFAKVEKGHKEKLMAVKEGYTALIGPGDVIDMKIGDYLVDVTPSPEMSFQDLLILAIKRETAARDLYRDLANNISDPSFQELFKKLAQEESSHKLSFETAYDEHFLAEN
jgi:rubrerythrin